MKRLLIPIGPAGAGKSTLAHLLQKELPNMVIFSPDAVRFDLLNSKETHIYYDQNRESTVWSIAFTRLIEALSSSVEKTLYWDATNTTRSRRYELIARALHTDPEIQIYYLPLNKTLYQCLHQNILRERQVDPKIIAKQYLEMEPVADWEIGHLITTLGTHEIMQEDALSIMRQILLFEGSNAIYESKN